MLNETAYDVLKVSSFCCCCCCIMIFANVQILFKWNANGQTINERFISFQEILYESIFAFVLILIILFVFFYQFSFAYYISFEIRQSMFDSISLQCNASSFCLLYKKDRGRNIERLLAVGSLCIWTT